MRISRIVLQCRRIKITILSKLIYFYFPVFFISMFFISFKSIFENIVWFFLKICLYLKLRARHVNNNIIFLSVFPKFRCSHITAKSKGGMQTDCWASTTSILLELPVGNKYKTSGGNQPYLRWRVRFAVCKWKVQKIIQLASQHRRKKPK